VGYVKRRIVQKHIVSKNTRLLKIGKLTFYIDDWRLLINTPDVRFPYPLSGQQTHQLLNLLTDYRTEIIAVSVIEQREQERKNKERQGHKKPQMIQVDGQWVESVELSELEKEQND
jgi:hypothetical protein